MGGVRYQQAPDALARDTLNGVLVLPATQDTPLLVTHPGDVIWALLHEPLELEDLTNQLHQAYGAPVEQIQRDVAPVLQELLDAGALKALPPRASQPG